MSDMIRRIGTVLASGGLALAVLLGLVGFAVGQTVLRPEPTQQALRQSGLYDEAAVTVLRQLPDDSVAGLTINDPAVTSAARQAFSADYVASVVEPGIVNTFGWLRGERTRPDFTLDYRAGQRDFAERLGQTATERAGQLPTCSLEQTLRLGSQFRQLLASGQLADVTCLPPGVPASLVGQAVTSYVRNGLASDSPYASGMVAAADITIAGRPFYEQAQLAQLPTAYQLLRWLPWLALLLGAACLLALFAIHRSGHVVALRLAISLIGGGLVGAILAASLRPLVHRFVSTYDDILRRIVEALAGHLGSRLQTASVVIILLGAVALVLIQWQTFRRLTGENRAVKPGQ